jgi:beta-glucoside operon transcriptional antiterminator
MATKFEQAVAEIPLEHILLAERVIAYARERLGRKLHDSIYVTLPDHMSTALERKASGMALKNPMLYEIKRFYRDEYEVGLRALEFVEESTGVEFDEDEAGFIAMHFVNASLDGDMEGFQAVTRVIEGILGVAEEHLGERKDEDSISWYRFVTHVRFFAQRVVAGKDYPDVDFELYDIVKEKYADSFSCARLAADFVAAELGHRVSKEEMAYLTLHIQRLMSRV